MSTDLNISCVCCQKNIQHVRGICTKCYWKQAKAIKSGKTTDAKLIWLGLRLPPKREDAKRKFNP